MMIAVLIGLAACVAAVAWWVWAANRHDDWRAKELSKR